MRRVGVLEVAGAALNPPRRNAFKQGMQSLGWRESHNVEYRFVSADGQTSRLDSLAEAMVADKPDVLATASAVSTRALQRATVSIPIVMSNVVDPVGNGFAASLAHPGGNITGLSNQQQDVLPKLVEFAHLLAPQAQRIGFLFNDGNPAYAAYRLVAQQVCAARGVTAVLVTAGSAEQLAGAVAQLQSQRVHSVVVAADPIYTGQAALLVQLLQPTRLPVVYGLRHHVEQGGLLSYGVNIDDAWRMAARYVDRLLKGDKPGDLPIQQPTRFEMVLSIKAAAVSGLNVPVILQLRADEVID